MNDIDANDAAGPDTEVDEPLRRHTSASLPASRRRFVSGNAVTLLPSGAAAIDAMVDAIDGAQNSLHLEYYEFADVHWRGRSIVDRLVDKLAAGVRVVVSYDAAGSSDTGASLFDRLRQAGALVLRFHPFNPLRRRFNVFRLNDRDHRKILIADGKQAILGGVNLCRAYENPRSAGAPADPNDAYWFDAAACIEGPAVAGIQSLFLANWRRQGGPELPEHHIAPQEPLGTQSLNIDGSAPRQHRPLYFESLKAAVGAAESHILLATGYFVPTFRQWRMLAEAAERGVEVDLLLPGYSDIPSCVRAARALYGRLIQRGVRIYEMKAGMLHAKVSTIDGVWSAIGSSNLDRRSFVYNNEIDAIVLGRQTAQDIEAMLRGWIAQADRITLAEWHRRSNGERAGELLARLWSRYM